MDGGDSGSGFVETTTAALSQSQTFDQLVRTLGLEDQCGSASEADDSQLVGGRHLAADGDSGVPAGAEESSPPAAADGQVVQASAATVGAVEQLTGKRRRGRPPKGQTAAPKPPPPKRNNEEEDVCFICFDGGSLVLCDRKGCPKAYHPACIKRDEAFFRSKAKWNCGWHICSVCQKAAHYLCYTCTYSLCKGCTKDAEYVCVRGNKGFCTTCMRTIMLIENKDTGNKEMVQVDFDDKTSWEYLFKVYWILLKDNLSLTINELMQAKSPWRGIHKQQASVVVMDRGQQSPRQSNFVNGSTVSISDKASENLELNIPKEQFEFPCHDSPGTEKLSSDNGRKLVECKDWASKELLELVSHMKNGDTSVLSPFDVQSLLLEYIKRNNLRDPHRKSQIICDLRLKNLFGKPRVGHIEMLKLLEYHFKENDQNNAFIPAGIVGSVAGHTGADQNSNLMIDITKKRRTRKKGEEKAPQTNLDEFAAIDVHNISLIYLRRDLMENLFGNEENFHDKVVGSIVRIRVSSNDQKQDVYRLVQVVGTIKAAEPYKLVDKTTNFLLEVLNLDKKETLSIDAISNQEFSQEECKRLRQSIRCGLVKRFTVGEVQMKAVALQALRLNDVLEAEILRLNHLRDRANEKGRKKELRECVEKLQRLKMPEERQRRLTEIPEVHADPKMNPNYESEEDVAASSGQKQDEFSRSKRSKFNNNGSQSIPPKGRAEDEGTKEAHCSNEKLDAKHEIQVTVSGSESGWCNEAVVKTSTANFSSGSSPSVNASEMDRVWHYRDPNGKVQGPFAMVQLRKWSTTGYFPTDMRIWTSDELNGSVLLTVALNGQFRKALPLLHNGSHSQDVGSASKNSFLQSFNLEQGTVHQVSRNGSEEIKSVLDDRSQSSHETTMHQTTSGQSLKSLSSQVYACQSSGQNLRPLSLDLDLNQKDSNSNVASMSTTPNDLTEQHSDTDMLDLPSPTPEINTENLEGQAIEKQRLDVPVQDAGISATPAPKPMNEYLSSPSPKEIRENVQGTTTKPTNEVLPSPSPKPADGEQGEQIAASNQSVPGKVSVSDSGPSWSASLEVGGSQLQEVAHGWSGYPPTAPKSSVGWDSGLVPMASVRPTEVLGDQVAIPNLNTNILPHSPSSLPASNISSWRAVVHEPIEFSTLAEESVSDLLAEVDAMESQSGLASPTSGIKCNDELMDSCRNDCFSSIEELSPTPEAGKSDAVSSGEVQFPSQSPVADDPGVDSQADVFDPQKRSDGHSASSSEGETRSVDTRLNPRETASDIHPPAGCTISQGMAPTPMTRGRGLESMDTGWSGLQGNMNMGWGGSPQGFPNIGWGSGLGGPWGNPNFNLGAYNGNLGWDSPRRYGAERFTGPRDWGFQGAEPGYGRGRPMWSRQPHGGGGSGSGGGAGGGSGYSRPPPKGQRVCKFYESGHCKKGASCDYLHP